MNIDKTTTNRKIRRELLKCANSPQGANKHTDGFLCCDKHVKLLMKKGLEPNQTNAFVCWYCLTRDLNKINDKLNKLEKEPKKNQDKIESAKIDKERIQQMLNKFPCEDVQLFISVKEHDQVIRRSGRINHKGRANLNECIMILNDSEYLEKVEEQLGEKNVSPELIQVRASMLFHNCKIHTKFL